MPRPRAINPKNRQHKHVELSDGDWVNIKQRLNYGEASELYDATYRSGVGSTQRGTAREVRMSEFNIQRLFIYVLAWSFIDDENKPLPLTVESIRMLDLATTEEIHEAINAIEAENDRLDQEGKLGVAPTATPNSSAGSSPSTPVGTSPAQATE